MTTKSILLDTHPPASFPSRFFSKLQREPHRPVRRTHPKHARPIFGTPLGMENDSKDLLVLGM